MFEPIVNKMLRADGIKLRGSFRTSRLRKKRKTHYEILYVEYRDKIFLKRSGLCYAEWRQINVLSKRNANKSSS